MNVLEKILEEIEEYEKKNVQEEVYLHLDPVLTGDA